MGQPLFILGKQRSGTTWLANQLSQHSQVAAVRNDHHGGVHESAFFSHVAGRYGDLSRQTNYVEFAEMMAASDTLRIAGVDKAFLYGLWPTTYEGVFRAVMDEVARTKGARYWLDKTPQHTLHIGKIALSYPDARFIAIVRDAREVLRSSFGSYRGPGWRRRLALARRTFNLVHHTKEIGLAGRSGRVRVVRFEELRSRPEETFRDLMAFLGLEFEPALLEQRYLPNTTFRAGRAAERDRVFSRGDERLVRAALALGDRLPVGGFRAVRRFARPDHKKPLPWWFFSMYPPVFRVLEEGLTIEQAVPNEGNG